MFSRSPFIQELTESVSTVDLFFILYLSSIFAILLGVFFWGLFVTFEDKKKQRLKYALLAFQSHTNPHFTKNVLQSINWFILNNDKTAASDYLCDFSLLMDDILKFSKKNFVTLSEKIEFLDLYLKLQHLRHKAKFDYVSVNEINDEVISTIQVDEDLIADELLLPPLLIHPFIENAIEHGLKPKRTKGFISVKFNVEYNNLLCTVMDNGIGRRASKKLQTQNKINRSRVGIPNTYKRFEIVRKLYGKNIRVEINDLYPDKEETGTLVKIKFPLPLNHSKEVNTNYIYS